jgi:cell division protein FtsA
MNDINRNDRQIAIALDIGTTKVCAMAGFKNEYGKIEVLGVGTVKSEGVSRGVVSNIDKTVKAIYEAIQIAQKNAKTKFGKVHVGIAGQHIKSIHHHGLLVRQEPEAEINEADVSKLISDMHKLVLPPGDKILHVFPQEFTVDDETNIVDPIGMSGVRLEANFHIITGQISASRNILRCVEKVGHEVADITLEPIASSKAVVTPEEKEAGVALVDIGGGTTDITIFKDGIIRHTSVIPFGGNVVTNDIKEGCTVMKDQAEKLKVKFGSALADVITDNRIITIPGFRGKDFKEISEKNLSKIIEARVREILDYVLWEIKRSGYESKLIAGIVLTGGGSLLRNIELLCEHHTGLSTRIGQPIEHLAHGYSSVLANPIYSTAVGLLSIAIDNLEAADKVATSFSNGDNNSEGDNEGEGNDDDEPEDNRNNLFGKLFTYTKDFFEGNPDTEL